MHCKHNKPGSVASVCSLHLKFFFSENSLPFHYLNFDISCEKLKLFSVILLAAAVTYKWATTPQSALSTAVLPFSSHFSVRLINDDQTVFWANWERIFSSSSLYIKLSARKCNQVVNLRCRLLFRILSLSLSQC